MGRKYTILLILALLQGLLCPAQSLETLKARKEKTKKEIEYTTFLLNKTGENTKASLSKLSLLNETIS